MNTANHDIVRRFFVALASGELPDDLLTPDMTVWTTTSGTSGKDNYQSGVRVLQSLFPDGLAYTVDSLTAEEDRVAAEVQSHGTLRNGVVFHNIYVFMFRIRDGRIASVAEHFNAVTVRELIMPLFVDAAPDAASSAD